MMRIRWTVPAADDLENIKNYLQRHFPHFAEATVRTIYQGVRSLKQHRTKADPDTAAHKELPIIPLPYVVVYSVKADVVEILHIYHGSQDWRR